MEKREGIWEEKKSEEQKSEGKEIGLDSSRNGEKIILEKGKEKERFHMEIESRSRNEEFARVVVAVFMSRLDPTLEEIDDVKTAVSEAVTNAIIHGYKGKEGIITIGAVIEEKNLIVTVEDKGAGIPDIEKAMEPMYTTDTTGERSGMGFSFMEAFMDQVFVRSKPGEGTVVTMKKRIGG